MKQFIACFLLFIFFTSTSNSQEDHTEILAHNFLEQQKQKQQPTCRKQVDHNELYDSRDLSSFQILSQSLLSTHQAEEVQSPLPSINQDNLPLLKWSKEIDVSHIRPRKKLSPKELAALYNTHNSSKKEKLTIIVSHTKKTAQIKAKNSPTSIAQNFSPTHRK